MKRTILYIGFLLVIVACKKDGCDQPKACFEKPDPGMCEAAIPKFYYNKVTKSCEDFVWGGCEGNVPFETLEECWECECSKRLE